MRKLRRWFGDETSGEDESAEESTDQESEHWDTVERKKRNKEKKKRVKAARELRVEETFEKSNHILGIGPISEDAVNDKMREIKDFRLAKIEAVRDFLRDILRFNKEELEDLKISDTVISAKHDGVIYVAFENKEDIHEIRLRIAESRNNDISARNYIPPQLYERYMYLNKICQVMRTNDERLRTQIRFGTKDLEVLTKTKGSEEPYKQRSLSELTVVADIPGFDFSKKWTQRVDRPPRRRAFGSPERRVGNPASGKPNALPPSRQNSLDTNPKKKQRKEEERECAEDMDEDEEEDPLEIQAKSKTTRKSL